MEKKKTLKGGKEFRIKMGLNIEMTGILYKKGTQLFSGWQKKNCYLLVNGTLAYSSDEKKPQTINGCIYLNQAIKIQSKEDTKFSIYLPGKEFELKAETMEDKEMWYSKIEKIINENDNYYSEDNSKKESSDEKEYKINYADGQIIDVIKASKLFVSKFDEDANQYFLEKQLDTLLSMNDSKTYTRVMHGVLRKQNVKLDKTFTTTWNFLYSHRPLRSEVMDYDETNVFKKKDWIEFDTLYVFEVGLLHKHTKVVDMSSCHEISISDDGDKFFLSLDSGEEKFTFYSEIKGERDLWYEALKNSKITGKEYNNSITKNPRNIFHLERLFNKGPSLFEKLINEEVDSKLGNIDDIKEYSIFEFTLSNLEEYYETTLDGIRCHSPFNEEMLILFTDIVSKKYFELVGTFWTNQYTIFEGKDLIAIALRLLNFNDKLVNNYKVQDENFTQNANEFINIYMKKANKNTLDMVENILKNERESKSTFDDNNKLMTMGPRELFEIISSNFAMIKDTMNKEIYIQTLQLFNVIVLQYLIGEDCVFSNKSIIIEPNFYIAIANNTFNFNKFLQKFVDEVLEMKVLDEDQANDAFRVNQISSALGMMNYKVIYKFVDSHFKKVSENYENVNFFDLDLDLVVTNTTKVFEEYQEYMLPLTQRKSWEEILNLTMFFYIRALLSNAYTKEKPVKEIIAKISRDRSTLFDYFVRQTGQNLAETSLKILDQICDFLGTSFKGIPAKALTLRENIGSSFSPTMARALILLKTDLTKEEKKEAVIKCRAIIWSVEDPNKGESRSFFEKMQNEMMQNEAVLNTNADLGEDELKEEEKKEEEYNNDLKSYISNLDDDEKEKPITREETFKINTEEKSEIVYQGYMKKTVYSFYHKRFFQLKQHTLFWFKSETSKKIQNKIEMKNIIKLDDLGEKKFMIMVDPNSLPVEGDKKRDDNCFYFECYEMEEKNKWMEVLDNEIHSLIKEEWQSNKISFVPLRKKVVKDLFGLPSICNEINKLKEAMESKIAQEKSFEEKKVNPELVGETGEVQERRDSEGSKTSKITFIKTMAFSNAFEDVEVNEEVKDQGAFDCCKKCFGFLGNDNSKEKESLNP
ncbi:MAG: PH domain-containing protein [archaeon]|nr:PH domain-containing protein [archaeon]